MISKDKQYKLTNCAEVIIFKTDGGGNYPIIGAWRLVDGDQWFSASWTAEGRMVKDRITEFDLVEIRPRIKRDIWVNVYSPPTGLEMVNYTREQADKAAISGRLACVKLTIECDVGEGL